MSIYLIKKELIEILTDSKLKFNIDNDIKRPVAKIITKEDKNNYLLYEDYNEEILEKLVSKKNVYIDLEFWNLNYCTKENIEKSLVNNFINNLEVLVDNSLKFSEGTIIILILIYNILLKTFRIKEKEEYLDYLLQLKISKKTVKNFLLGMKHRLPLTENYLELLYFTFDSNSIIEYCFKENNILDFNEYKVIIEKFKVKDIDFCSQIIFESKLDTRNKLKYVSVLIENFEEDININNLTYYNLKKEDKSLGLYLMTLKINNSLEDIYYCVIKKYLSKNGSTNINIIGNKDTEDMVKLRKQEISEYFDLS